MRSLRDLENNFYPELALFESPEEARRTKYEFYRRSLWWWVYIVILILVTAIFGFWLWYEALARFRPWVSLLILVLIGGTVGGGSAHWLFSKPFQQHLRKRLLDRGVKVCMACGYDLRGQTECRCPECGTPFESSQ